MISFNNILLATAIAMISATAIAVKPTSIKYIEDIVVQDELIYSHYVVKCSNGKTTDIGAWDNRKQWCLGKGSQDICYNKQLKAAKVVCEQS